MPLGSTNSRSSLAMSRMGKKIALDLIRPASQPFAAEDQRSIRDDGYTDKKILRRTNASSKARLHGKSRPKNASTGGNAFNVVRRNTNLDELFGTTIN